MYSLPEDGHEIEIFGAVSQSTDNTEPPEVEEFQPGERDEDGCQYCVETYASLENVEYVEVYEDVEDLGGRICMGILFTYSNGSKACVEQRRIGLPTTKVTRYNNPTSMYLEKRYTHPARKDENPGEADGYRFFFRNGIEDQTAIREYLDGWTSSGTALDHELWTQELLSRKCEMAGSLWWLVEPKSYILSFDRANYVY